MKRNEKHIVFEDFRRYRANEMTPIERNAFEKQLQKDPFMAEAMEGLEQLSPEEMSQHVHEISTRISSSRNNRKNRFIATAASILILVSIGILWLQINKQNPLPQLGEAQKTEVPAKEQKEEIIPLKEPIVPENEAKKDKSEEVKPVGKKKIAEQKEEASDQEKSKIEKKESPDRTAIQEQKPGIKPNVTKRNRNDVLGANSDSNLFVRGIGSGKSNQLPPTVNVFRGKIISAEDKKPLPGATITVLGATKGVISDIDGNFSIQLDDSDSSLVASFIGMESKILSRADGMNANIELEPKDQELENITVVAFAKQKKQSVIGSIGSKPVSFGKAAEGLASGKSNQIPANVYVYRGKVISSSDKMPLPGVTIVENGKTNGTVTDIDGNFILPLKDSISTVTANFIGMEPKEISVSDTMNSIIELKPKELALDEVVVVGYGVQKKQSATGSITNVSPDLKTENMAAQPVSGYKTYYEYLNSEAILPTDYPENKVVVKLRIKINTKGKIESIEKLNEVDEVLFEKAKQIIKNGTVWKQEIFDGKKVDSTVKLRIVFRKKK